MNRKPLLVMLAGPNGAGKSTFYTTYLTQLGLPFLNADVLGATYCWKSVISGSRSRSGRRPTDLTWKAVPPCLKR